MKYIDIHGHINFAAYDADREDVIKRAKDADVAMVAVGTQLDTSKKALGLAHKHDNVYAIVGLHPVHTCKSHHDDQEFGVDSGFTEHGEAIDRDAYMKLAKDPKVIALGECGLDYFHLDEGSREKQIKAFEIMIDIANEVKKPLMLHIRNGKDRNAYREAYEILKSRSKVLCDLHFFAGNIEDAKLFLDLGYYFSFTGVITFARNYDEVIQYLPLNRIMSETDCPYVSPVPFRGKRNEPVNVIEVVKTLARIRGESEDVVTKQVMDNAKKFFDFGQV
ncbi:MAG: TatD family hydrolase [Candidatus Paceibacterota bacterium]